MSAVDNLIKEQFVPFRQKVIETLRTKHPHILPIVDRVLSGKKNRIGLQVTENGNIIGEFTFHLNGINIEETKSDNLSPEFNHPFLGMIKPYIVVEKKALESIIQDEAFSHEPLSTFGKHLPNIIVKFKN
ncbi:MAG: hypothetical protein H6Q68_63 [Firmicutes bacterium]|nr:hypothetical protein [Bacillota bacterium]